MDKHLTSNQHHTNRIELILRASGQNTFVTLVCCAVGLSQWLSPLRTADAKHGDSRVQSRELAETSGLVVSRRNDSMVWLHNDGRDSRVFAIRPTGETVAVVQPSVRLIDVEDIAIGPGPLPGRDYIYLADIGDNEQTRDTIQIARFPEPDLNDAPLRRLSIEDLDLLTLAYPDDPFDAEALFVDPENGDVYIVTKEKRRSRVFFAQAKHLQTTGVTTLQYLTSLGVQSTSGGDMRCDGQAILLRSEDEGWLWRRRLDQTVGDALRSQLPQKVDVRRKRQEKNGEAIGFINATNDYYSISEGKREYLCRFSIDED